MGPEEKKIIDEAPPGIITDVKAYQPWFFHDESRLSGTMETLSFPRTAAEVAEHVAVARAAGQAITVQGMRTGITGGAVPCGGHVVNCNRMRRFLGLRRDPETDDFLLRMEPGVFMRNQIWSATTDKEFDTSAWDSDAQAALAEFKRRPRYVFPPDPSEPTISIGGMVANNASGARSFHYGPTRRYVESLTVLLIDGDTIHLRRGQAIASGRRATLMTSSGRMIAIQLPAYTTPRIKTSAGYFVRDNMDMVDLFIGAEGTLGITTEIEIRLIPEPRELNATMFFFPEETAAVGFAKEIRDSDFRPTAIELYDHNSLQLMRSRSDVFEQYQRGHEIPPGRLTALYCEYHTSDPAQSRRAMESYRETGRRHGARQDATWTDAGADALAAYKQIKHMLPELVNAIVAEHQKEAPGIRKLGTDLSVPDDHLDELMRMYHDGLEAFGAEYYLFGHLGDNNLHANIIPKSDAEYQAGRELYHAWARRAVEMGGTVSAEHGIGKIKKEMATLMFTAEHLSQMRAIKRMLDPEMLINRGNIFAPE